MYIIHIYKIFVYMYNTINNRSIIVYVIYNHIYIGNNQEVNIQRSKLR